MSSLPSDRAALQMRSKNFGDAAEKAPLLLNAKLIRFMSERHDLGVPSSSPAVTSVTSLLHECPKFAARIAATSCSSITPCTTKVRAFRGQCEI
jgi:hypothetical protein